MVEENKNTEHGVNICNRQGFIIYTHGAKPLTHTNLTSFDCCVLNGRRLKRIM